MTTATPALMNGNAGINRGLKRYAEALAAPRRQRARLLGPDVDSDYCLTDFLFSLGTRDEARLKQVYQAERTKAPLGQASGPAGGYLVPEDLSLDLMQDVGENALMRPRATICPMQAATVRLALPDATTAQTAGTAPYFGGLLMKWTSEGTTRPETEPIFREVDLHAWDLTGYALQSNPLFQDGGQGLESFLRQVFARSIAWYEDYAYLVGDGVGKPLGVAMGPAVKVVTRQTTVTFTVQDLGAMSAALLPQSWERAIWVVSPSVWAKLVILNTNAWQVNQPIAEGTNKPHFTLNGQGGFISGSLPVVGTQGDILLFDPQLYVIGDRGAVEIAVSFDEPTAFLKNQAVWRVTYRGDGQPWFSKPITIADASTSVSPYVVLSTL